MTMTRESTGTMAVETAVRRLASGLGRVTVVLAPPVLRIALAVPFFRSGLTKWDGVLSLSPAAVYLFEEEFKLHILGSAYGFPAPLVAAHLTGIAEIVLSVLLVLGLGTRFAAFGLFIMTGVIQLVVPDGWANFHLPWAAIALAIMALGPGALSLDRGLDEFCRLSSRVKPEAAQDTEPPSREVARDDP